MKIFQSDFTNQNWRVVWPGDDKTMPLLGATMPDLGLSWHDPFGHELPPRTSLKESQDIKDVYLHEIHHQNFGSIKLLIWKY